MTALVAIELLGLYRSHHAGEVAGFPAAEAEAIIRAGRGRRHALDVSGAALPADAFDGLSRAALIAFGRQHFDIVEEPPADASDDDLRAALRELAAEHRAADFQAGHARLDHPTQSAQVDGAVTLRGVGTGNAVARKATSRRLLPPPSPAGDQLDAVDRPHLEALAKIRLGLVDIDPELSDAELRDQIRALSEAATDGWRAIDL